MSEAIQLHLRLAFKHEPEDHPRIRALLERGYRITQLQRLTDAEVLVTLHRPAAVPAAAE